MSFLTSNKSRKLEKFPRKKVKRHKRRIKIFKIFEKKTIVDIRESGYKRKYYNLFIQWLFSILFGKIDSIDFPTLSCPCPWIILIKLLTAKRRNFIYTY